MNRMMIFIVLALFSTIAVPAQRDHVQLIADRAGVSVNDVRMVLGSRTQFAQYRTSFDRKEARVMKAIAELTAMERDEREQRDALVAKQDK